MAGKDDLLNEIPDWVANSSGFQAVFGAIGSALDRFRSNRQDVYNQLFITTSTWALQFWENELELAFDPNLTDDQRRQRVLGRFRSRQTPTPKAVRAMANSFQNGDVETYMDWEKYTLYVRFVDVRGVPSNISELQDQITKMVDANLQVVFQFRYLTVGELANWGGSVSSLLNFGLTVRQLMTWLPVTVRRGSRDLAGRFRLKSPSMFGHDAGVRFRLIQVQNNIRNISTRMRITSGNASRDWASRFSLISPHQPIYWGAWIDYSGQGANISPNSGSFGSGGTINGSDALSIFESHVGKKCSIVHINNGNWMSNGAYVNFSHTNIDPILNRGTFVLSEWFPWDLQNANNDSALRPAYIARGDHDTYITNYANAVKAWGGPIIFRMGHEMNASWSNAWPWACGVNGSATVTFGANTWTNTESDYINYFRHVVSIFRSVGCTNAKFLWCPNVRAPSDHPYANYYPGNDANGKPYADYLGWDGYPWFGNALNQSWRAGQTTVDTYNEISTLNPTLPIFVAEFGYLGRRGSTMGITSITASGSQLTVVVPSSPGGGGWAINQGLVITSSNPSTFNGSYTITNVTGTGPYTLTVSSTKTGSFVSGTAAMTDRLTRAPLITSDWENSIPAMPNIKALTWFWVTYSDDQWTLDYTGTSDQINNYDLLAFKTAVGNAHYLKGGVLGGGGSLLSYPMVPFENQAVSDRYQQVIKSTGGLNAFYTLADAALSTAAVDSSGNARNGVINGNIQIGSAGSIPSQSALTSPIFPGAVGNNVQIADDDVWSPGTTGKFAIELSYYLPSLPTAQGALMGKAAFGGQLAGAVYEWQFWVSGTQIAFVLNQGTGATYASNVNALPSIGAWHHVIVNCDLSSATPVSMTIDGVNQPNGTTITGTLSNGTAPVMIGQKYDSGSPMPFPNGGRIAMVSAYGSLLSTESKVAHYAAWH